MNFLNTWQFNLLGYFISIVFFFQFYKLAVKNAQKDGPATVLLQIIASVSILFLAPLFPLNFPSDIKVYLLLILACIFYALNDRLQTSSRKHLQVSVFTILNQLSNVFLIVIGLTVFREPFILTKFLGTGLIIVANVLLFYQRGNIKIDKYAWIGILSTIFMAIAISIDIGNSKQFNLPIYIALTLFLPALMIFLGERLKFSEIIHEYHNIDRKYYLITGISWALAIFFLLRSFQFGKVTTVVPLQATSVLFNVLIAYFILGEKEDKCKKIISAILVIVGVFLIVKT